MQQEDRFIIVREDLDIDPVTVATEGLLIGRLVECELLLNHPAVSRVQAGIRNFDGNYYVFGFRASNPIKLNGKPVDENEALASGDILEVGPFEIEIDISEEALTLKVALHIGHGVDSLTAGPDTETGELDELSVPPKKKKAVKPRAATLPGTKALDIFWDKRIRDAGKMVRPSPLFPRGQRRAGKAQFNWIPTTDLASRWPASYFVWSVIIVGFLAVTAALWYTNAYASAPLSHAHAKTSMDLVPSIAAQPSGNSCTNCHSFTGNMEASCSGCHQAEAFTATVIDPHVAAGIGCVSCHAEHQGADFKPAEAALFTCSECHNDANSRTYNGRSVSTPHQGGSGYPVVDGRWKWKGLNDEEWLTKEIGIERLPGDSEEQWRSKQFHALHMHRVRTVNDIPGNAAGELSCSSCHDSFDPIDRATPRKTCDDCHNGKIEAATRRIVIVQDQPNCTSCHVQHVKSKRHWNPALMVQR
ncbi:MAG TPA: FHA domain-containing protein [Pyrinomonadaceae bacterium]|nr:FHA domain-containing protein [Pyrinomonadaceae bacterium]